MSEGLLNTYMNLNVPNAILKMALNAVGRGPDPPSDQARQWMRDVIRYLVTQIRYEFPEIPPNEIGSMAENAFAKALVRKHYPIELE
jgi:hypothetical protein